MVLSASVGERSLKIALTDYRRHSAAAVEIRLLVVSFAIKRGHWRTKCGIASEVLRHAIGFIIIGAYTRVCIELRMKNAFL